MLPSVIDVGIHGPTHNLFPAPLEELVENLDKASRMCVEAGITTVVDPQVTAREMPAYVEAARTGRLHVRVACMYLSNHLGDLERLGLGSGLGGRDLWIAGVKLYSDGSLAGGTAAFFDPYANTRADRGLALWSERELAALVSRADRLNLQVGIHAGRQGNRACAHRP